MAKRKCLLLMRHAKSSWDDASLDDFDRPLASRGERAAPAMGREIAVRGWYPDLALISPAVRARQTWELVAPQVLGMTDVRMPELLYMAEPEVLLAQLRTVPARMLTVLLLGHNPGLETLAERLASEASEAEALAQLRRKFQTAALARFEFDGSWRALAAGHARLTHFLRPKDIAS